MPIHYLQRTDYNMATNEALKARISTLLEAYDAQGIHRTGTDVDTVSAEWMAEEIKKLGLWPELVGFPFERLDIKTASLTLGETNIEGVPQYDGGVTGAEGITGKIGPLLTTASIGLVKVPPHENHPDAKKLIDARRNHRHDAFIAVTDEESVAPGIALMNSEDYLQPYGPPVLQVSSEHWQHLSAVASDGETVKLVIDVERTPTTAYNVQTRIAGWNNSASPLVVMTPRSGWWQCTSERGGGLAVWFEMMRTLAESGPRRPVIFTANTGHELSHIGLQVFLENNPKLIQSAHLWVHLGANFAAVKVPEMNALRFQASDENMQKQALDALAEQGIVPESVKPIPDRPSGEARNIFDGGGRYISLLGSNGLFHHPDDRWPHALDLDRTSAITQACNQLSLQLVS
ncbi:MAG: hypothetical protein AAF512_17075 [Pseudomonadota bacterium]